ncbi:MAG TPA: cation diffusion facilitator family transporter [Actinomycetota bacterium]|nr:cation diffusion facilitator family transporter [Actinomycetota bacterium]
MTRTARLWLVLAANLALVGALLAVGIFAHSVGVLAEGADYLADAAAIGVSLAAVRLAARPPTPKRPAGYPRATRCAAMVNAGWLLALNVLVAAEAVRRLSSGVHEVHGLPMLVASGVAAVVMLGGALLLGGAGEGDEDEGAALNRAAVLLDTAGDAAAAGGVAVAGAVITVTGGTFWLDPAVALVIAVVVSYHSARLGVRIAGSLKKAAADRPGRR